MLLADPARRRAQRVGSTEASGHCIPAGQRVQVLVPPRLYVPLVQGTGGSARSMQR